MTWTVFEYTGDWSYNETGKYTHVLVEATEADAIDWWSQRFGHEPKDWSVHECPTEEDAIDCCGEVKVEAGGIGVEKTRAHTIKELHEADRVLVMQESTL